MKFVELSNLFIKRLPSIYYLHQKKVNSTLIHSIDIYYLYTLSWRLGLPRPAPGSRQPRRQISVDR